jgi:hypothetical protein
MSDLIDVPLQTRSLRGSRSLTAADFRSAGFGKFRRSGTRVGGGGLVSLDSVFVMGFSAADLRRSLADPRTSSWGAFVRFFFDGGGGVESGEVCGCGSCSSGGSDCLRDSEGGRDECGGAGVDDLAAGA